MLFNSFSFFIFFPLVTGLYFLLPHRQRWALLLTASCIFYMYFIPKYILILAFTIVVDYFAGLLIENARGGRRRVFLGLSIIANVGVLALFKYFNFLNENLAALAHFLGWNYSMSALSLVLPIGLSFHTFQAMSYTIEVYRGKHKAERHFGIYALYVMFYPQLVAGPIERPQNLLPQFRERHNFDYERVASGLRLIAWGLFKKAVVADRLALFVNKVYAEPGDFDGPVLVLATLFFAFQIYCDFSGYSEIAIGSARVMGFRLMQNFDRPYHARNISEFWRRWHISLSTWFRDYLYFPMGGNRVTAARWTFNIMTVFLISGLWHGANWTYVVWGGLHGFFLVFGAATLALRKRMTAQIGLGTPLAVRRAAQTTFTFCLVCITWIFFRAASVDEAWLICRRLFTGWSSVLQLPVLMGQLKVVPLSWLVTGVAGIVTMELVEAWRARDRSALPEQPWWFRWTLYYGVAGALLFLHTPESIQFIYFQF
jgi:alginate O-acetyltransferase complex protein AlgI